MLRSLRKNPLILAALGFVFVILCSLPGFAKLPQSVPLLAQRKQPDVYEQAKKDLPESFYVMYRIIEKTARANQLDENPWRTIVVPEYDINAFATDVNLVAVYDGILDQISGDTSALAFIVGHEMAHHTLRHQALDAAEREALVQKTSQEAVDAINQEVEAANSEATTNNVLGGIVGMFGGVIGQTGQVVLNDAARQRIETAKIRIEEIKTQKRNELNQQLAAQSREQEFAADEVGYQYMARAGFDPEGAFRIMTVLGRTPNSEFDTTHPAIPKRVEALKALMKKYPARKLADEGKARLASTKPLTYSLSRDQISLRINSKRGDNWQF